MEGSTLKAHYLKKPGAQLDLQTQFDRVVDGINPTTVQMQYKPPAATELGVSDPAKRHRRTFTSRFVDVGIADFNVSF